MRELDPLPVDLDQSLLVEGIAGLIIADEEDCWDELPDCTEKSTTVEIELEEAPCSVFGFFDLGKETSAGRF